MHRRDALKIVGSAFATSALPGILRGDTPPTAATFTIGRKTIATIPSDFMGLSYESAQLSNPRFFSASNTELVKLYRELSPQGVLRTGGNLSAFSAWRDDLSAPLTAAEKAGIDRGKNYWEWALCDPTIAKGSHEAIFTPASIEALAGFLNATGWKLLYGLNFGTGTPEQAAAEAACVQRLVGKNLIGFQLGNEVDFWTGGLRSKNWDFDQYLAQWLEWVRIIRAKGGDTAFAGPDIAVRLDWVEKMAERLKNEVVLLTGHHYAMGPAGDPQMNAAHLLRPDPEVAKEIVTAQRAKAIAGVSFRVSECNSCFHGGQPGVSNAYAASLWSADYILALAQGGHAGVNLHSGGEGIYSPITGDKDKGFTRQPLYFGMKFAQQFAGVSMLDSTLSVGGSNVTAYAGYKQDTLLVAIINKEPAQVAIGIAFADLKNARLVETWKLSAPSIDSTRGITFAKVDLSSTVIHRKESDLFQLEPYTAILARYSLNRPRFTGDTSG